VILIRGIAETHNLILKNVVGTLSVEQGTVVLPLPHTRQKQRAKLALQPLALNFPTYRVMILQSLKLMI
jgi:hypothetical protein